MSKKLLFLLLGLGLTAANLTSTAIASTCTDNCLRARQTRNHNCSFLDFDARPACMEESQQMYEQCLADCADAGMG